MSAAALEGTLPNRAVAITFDDGYADNLYAARPLLERHEMPATVFVTTGSIGGTREYWWDEIDRVLLQPGRLPDTLSIKINNQEYRWELGEAADYDADAHQAHRCWRAWGEPDPSVRHLLYRSIYQLLYPLPEGERRKAQDELLTWAGVPSVAGRASHRVLSARNWLTSQKGNWSTSALTPSTHSLLSAASGSAQQDYEILQSKAQLEEALGRPVTSFAYPFGKRGDTPSRPSLSCESQGLLAPARILPVR